MGWGGAKARQVKVNRIMAGMGTWGDVHTAKYGPMGDALTRVPTRSR